MRILLAQLNPRIGDLGGNKRKILSQIAAARQQKIDMVLFPELAISGYPPGDFVLLSHFAAEQEAALEEIVQASAGITLVIGVFRRLATGEKRLANSAAVIENRQLLGFQDKCLLPTYDVFDERRFFEPAAQTGLWTLCGKRVAVTICEDIWQHSELLRYVNYSRDPIKDLQVSSPDLILNLSASPFSVTNLQDRIVAAGNAARTLKAPLLLCNQVGGNDSLIFDGHSLYIDAHGTLVDYAKGFEEDAFVVDLDRSYIPRRQDFDPMKQLYQALVLGVRDYFNKSGFTSACIGLSGGIDSALAACIAVEALGAEHLLGLLMPSRYTSQESIQDAEQLARRLSINTEHVSIEGPFESYLELLAPFFKGRPPDVTEENFQARIRGMILMAFSNKFGSIVLSTGNKSELAMGYSTLYGDMCGGLALIGDLTKGQVYELSRWINRKEEIIPWRTISKAPSAELRPNQKDSDSLPDYEIVDNVLQAYVEEYKTPQQIAERFGYPIELVLDLVRRIHRNEYKRRQSPPGLRISNKSFSVGRCFPIVQGFA